MNKDEITENQNSAKFLGFSSRKDSPLLSCLFFVTGGWVHMNGVIPEGLILPGDSWIGDLAEKGALTCFMSLDQIRSDVESWVEMLSEGDKTLPVPRVEYHEGKVEPYKFFVFADADTIIDFTRADFGSLEPYIDKLIPLVQPATKYTANWTRIHPRCFMAEDVPALCTDGSMLELGVSVLTHLNENQPTSFSVWRLEIVRGEG